MTTHSRVSILLRTRDRPVFLARCLESLAAQTFPDWQAVIVDQGDAAVTTAVLENLNPALRERLIHVPVPRDLRLGAMLNRGVAAGDSDYLVCLDDDDSWWSNYLEIMVNALENKPGPGYGGVVCQCVTVFERINDAGVWEAYEAVPKPSFGSLSIRDLAQRPTIPIHTFMYERRCHAELAGYSEEMSNSEDWHFHTRFIQRFGIAVVDQVLARYHKRPQVAGAQANSSAHLPAGAQYDVPRWKNREIRRYLETDPSRMALLRYLGQMEQSLETQVVDMEKALASMQRRLEEASEKVGKIDARTRLLTE